MGLNPKGGSVILKDENKGDFYLKLLSCLRCSEVRKGDKKKTSQNEILEALMATYISKKGFNRMGSVDSNNDISECLIISRKTSKGHNCGCQAYTQAAFCGNFMNSTL